MLAYLANGMAGAAIGLLLGAMIGMSVTPVVASVIGALTAAAVAFIGLREPNEQPPAGAVSSAAPAIRLAAFAVAALCGVMGGVYARTHGIFDRSPADRLQEWERAGFAKEEARALVLFQETGILPPGWSAARSDGAAADAKSMASKSVLYSARTSYCKETTPERFESAKETLDFWRVTGGEWQRVAETVEKSVATDKQSELLARVHQLTCSE